MTIDQARFDASFAAAALRYGVRHAGLTNPNPCVAAILVQYDGETPRVAGRGVTAPGGRPHAETIAIEQAGDNARGATLYVTLEPCSHHGKTPPCSDAIVKSGIARVIACMADPDPRVSGKGFAGLQAAGIEVVTPILENAANRVHAAHISTTVRNRPHVALKMAVSRDGMIGRRGAGQIAISGPETWNYVQALRADSDAILVGVGTVLNDDPSLTCRLPGLESRSPLRVVLDKGNQTPQTAKLLSDKNTAETVVLNGYGPQEALTALLKRGVQSVMIEGGAKVASSFLSAGLVDAIHLVQADMSIGEGGIAAPLELMQNADAFETVDTRMLGTDKLTLYWRKDWMCSPEL